MFVLSSPSGAGKTTLTRLLLEEDQNVGLSVSVTTRARRPSEVEGKHYHFITRERVRRHARRGRAAGMGGGARQFLRHAQGQIEKLLGAGKDMLFDIDWQGTLQLYAKAAPTWSASSSCRRRSRS